MTPEHEAIQWRDHSRREADDHSVRLALLEQGMESIKVQLGGINASINKLVWLVFSALIVAVLKLVILN